MKTDTAYSNRQSWVLRALGLLLFSSALFPLRHSTASEAFAPPASYAPDRYESLWKKSPFTLASTEEVVTVGFADNLVLVGAATIGEEYIVTILDRATSQRHTISSKGENASDITLLSVETLGDPLKATASIRKGSETAEIRFDPALIKSMPTATASVVHVPPAAGGRAPRGIREPSAGNPPQQINTGGNPAIPQPPPRRPNPRRRLVIPGPAAN